MAKVRNVSSNLVFDLTDEELAETNKKGLAAALEVLTQQEVEELEKAAKKGATVK